MGKFGKQKKRKQQQLPVEPERDLEAERAAEQARLAELNARGRRSILSGLLGDQQLGGQVTLLGRGGGG